MQYPILEKQLGYIFNNTELLTEALTHRSVSNRNYERLEYLGDSIVNFIIAEDLFQQFPNAFEGQLSRMRATLVKKETLASIARDLDISDFLILGSGELKSGGFRRDSILADAVESLVAAIYLDSDLDRCRETVLQWFGRRLKSITPEVSNKDPKTRLQEYTQARKYTMPEYTLLKTEGEAHNQLFFVSCTISSLSKTTEGSGRSRRRAEQDAAEILLKELHV